MWFLKNKYSNIHIPADVPRCMHDRFACNYAAITKNTGRLFLFSADQKMEHLNKDFYGNDIATEANNPAHIFTIASQTPIGALATQLGLIARYASHYRNINYIVKLNGKTDLISFEQEDPLSKQLWSVEQAIQLANNSRIHIRGVGYTIYVGSEFEPKMLHQAAQIVYEAHQHGLIAILWVYPRGKAITHPKQGNLIAGAAGLACALGADFVKINPPEASENKSSAQWLAIAAQAAGNTKVVCAGGARTDAKQFLPELYEQLHTGKTAGCAIGRNLFQRSLADAQKFANAVAALVYGDVSVSDAVKLLI